MSFADDENCRLTRCTRFDERSCCPAHDQTTKSVDGRRHKGSSARPVRPALHFHDEQEDEYEERHRFGDAQHDQVVGEAFVGFCEGIAGRGRTFALEESR